MAANILVVDDESRVRFTIKSILERAGHRVLQASSGAEALSHLERDQIDVALIDVMMPQMDGLELLKRVRARWPQVAVILITAYPSIPSTVSAMKLGAFHYLEKTFTQETLLETIQKARAEFGGSGGSTDQGSPFRDLVGEAPAFQDARELARRSADTDKPVLILGEVGTGRETMARTIHAASPRKAAQFVPLRCAAAGNDLDAELFGSSGGNPGRLHEANAGTIYIDGVEQLPEITQARLLRYLRDGEIQREPGGPVSRVDVHVIAASAYDLEKLVDKGSFRQDLFYSLRAMEIRLPALRDRRADITRLAQHFLKRSGGRGAASVKIRKEATRVLMSLQYPGNLKQLEEILEQAVPLATGGEITVEVLEKLGIAAAPMEADNEGHAMRTRVEQEEKKAIEEELRRNPKNLKQAAQNLNISRTTLWRKMKKYDMDAK